MDCEGVCLIGVREGGVGVGVGFFRLFSAVFSMLLSPPSLSVRLLCRLFAAHLRLLSSIRLRLSSSSLGRSWLLSQRVRRG